MTAPYSPPLDRLLTLGEAKRQDPEQWLDYRGLGLGEEHVPELLRLAVDRALHEAEETSADVWAPLHAWRALGQLRAAEAVRPLLEFMEEMEDKQWLLEEVPEVGGLVGAPAIPVLGGYLAEKNRDLYSRVAAGNGLERIGSTWPEARDACIAALAAQLEGFAEDDPTLNGFVIGYLVDLGARQALPTIAAAFAADRVDIGIGGDLEDVEIELGVRTYRETPAKLPPHLMDFGRVISRAVRQEVRKAAAQAKRKKKAAKAARRRNRR